MIDFKIKLNKNVVKALSNLNNIDNKFVPINGYEGIYSIDCYGNIKNANNKLKSTFIEHGGYKAVILYKNNKYKKFKVHRLVAEHFIDNTYNFNIVNHIDNDKTNNFYKNLEWCSQSHNVKVGDRTKQLSSKVRIEEFGKIIKRCSSIKEAAKFLNVTAGSIATSLYRNGRKHSSLINNKYLVYYD